MTKQEKDKLIAELRAEVEMLRTIIEIMPGNVYWNDCNGNYLGCNQNAAQLLNLDSPNGIIGKNQLEVCGPIYAEKMRQTDLEIIKNKEEQSLEEKGYTLGGLPATYLTKKKPFFNREGEVQGILGVSFDITERKSIEEKLRIAKQKAESANRAKSRFLAMISHELRTPLTSVMGFASLIEQGNLQGEKKREYLKHILNSGSYLLSLINSLLDYNKLETNKFEIVNLPLNLKELIENVVAVLSGTAELKQLPLTFNYDPSLSEQIMGNSRALRQILFNLIGNAIKFTEKGYVAIKATALTVNDKSIDIEISVKDTGIGIPQNEQQSIFKRFYQLGNIYTRNTSLTGTGLGLTIVKKLAKLMGGKIEVISAPDKGSTFFFTAKFSKVCDSAPWLPYASSVKILVIQDNSERNFISSLLTNTTYDIVSSKEAIDTLFSAQQTMRPYDIIILDNMLQISPQDLLDKIQDQCDLHQPLPILLNSDFSWNREFNDFNMITENPSATDIQDFQNKLKLSWESWQTHNQKAALSLLQSENPYVLLIEDNYLIQLVHKHMLEDLHYRVDTTDTAASAIEMLKNGYDLLIVDIGLPDISGFELIKTIRQNPDAKNTPIIVLTGYSEEEERQHCLRAGANEVAIKPVFKATLAAMLDKYIKQNLTN